MNKFFRLFRPKFFLAFLRNVYLKVIFGKRLKINLFKVFISKNVNIRISGQGSISLLASRDRIYISPGCDLVASGGVIEIQSGFFMNKNGSIISHKHISIGEDCMLGPNVGLYDSDHEFKSTTKAFRFQGYKMKEISVEDNVWIGANTIVLGGAYISKNSVIGANSLVRSKLSGDAVYAGNPLKIIKSLSEG